MATKKHTRIPLGTLVKTTQENPALHDEWTAEAQAKRKWDVKGVISAQHDSHGLCYEVQHHDGTTGCYDPSELQTAPKSYRNIKRPELLEAMSFEPGTIDEVEKSLKRKGYFEPPPRPWKLGASNRGGGRGNFAVLDRFDDVVVETRDCATAELIIKAVKAFKVKKKKFVTHQEKK